MFRKLYKEANDEISVNEKLIDDIFTKANNENNRTIKKFNYKYMYSAAAAIVLVLGCSTAITKLMEKTVPETSGVIPAHNEEVALVEDRVESNVETAEIVPASEEPEINSIPEPTEVLKKKSGKTIKKSAVTKKQTKPIVSDKKQSATEVPTGKAEVNNDSVEKSDDVSEYSENTVIPSPVYDKPVSVPESASVKTENIPVSVKAEDESIPAPASIAAEPVKVAESDAETSHEVAAKTSAPDPDKIAEINRRKLERRGICGPESDIELSETEEPTISNSFAQDSAEQTDEPILKDKASGGGSSQAISHSYMMEAETIEDSMNLPDDFSLTSESAGYYKYSGSDEKSFEIYENTEPPEEPVLSFSNNGNDYSVTAENMSDSEIEEIFEDLK